MLTLFIVVEVFFWMIMFIGYQINQTKKSKHMMNLFIYLRQKANIANAKCIKNQENAPHRGEVGPLIRETPPHEK